MSNRLSTRLIALLVLALLSACVAPPATGGATQATDKGQTADAAGAAPSILRIPHPLTWGGKESMDPASPVEFQTGTVLVYDRLARLDAGGAAQPELATAWQANEDATTWTFTLREGVTFHDGKPFTAADVAYTFAHILDPALESQMAATFAIIVSTETPDAQTIVFHLQKGHADFPLLLTHRSVAIIPDGSGETIGQTGIGTGPFILETFVPDGVSTYRANENYWKGAPQVAGIDLISMPSAESRTLALQAGQIDLVFDATAAQAALVASNADFTLLRYPTNRFTTLVMLTDTPPFDDVRVRRAIRMVADRQAIIDLVLDGEGTISCDTPVGPDDIYRWNYECPQDIDGAKALLVEAGYPDGIDVTLYTADYDPTFIPLAEVYQQQAAAAGINVDLQIVPSADYWNTIWMIQPFITSFWTERPADQILNDGWRSTAAWNESRFNNPAFDQLLDQARAELDFATRKATYQAAQELLFQESGVLVPFHINQFTLVSSKVSGVPARNWTSMEWITISKSE